MFFEKREFLRDPNNVFKFVEREGKVNIEDGNKVLYVIVKATKKI
jgi:hypothetical protein